MSQQLSENSKPTRINIENEEGLLPNIPDIDSTSQVFEPNIPSTSNNTPPPNNPPPPNSPPPPNNTPNNNTPVIVNKSNIGNPEDQFQFLQLGDIIKVTSTNESSNNKIYYIKYIGPPTIKVIENTSLDESEWNFTNGVVENGDITKIIILKREETPSYAKQNNLLEYAWINITFEDFSNVMGQITKLEEDMIEIKVYPDNEIIYINFDYKGIPLDIGIAEIKLTNAPPKKKFRIDEEVVQPIQQRIEVESRYFRYSIEEQTNDFLEVLLSKIPSSKRSDSILNGFNKLITRFTQLRSKYTKFDSNNNIISSEKPFIRHTSEWKPLIKPLSEFNNKLFWILLVGKFRKKNFVDKKVLYADLEKINESYINNNFSPEQNPYFELYKSINPLFTPFTNIDRNQIENLLCQIPVKTNMDIINNYSGNFDTSRKKFYSQRFNTGLSFLTQTKLVGGIYKSNFFDLTEPDILSLESIITLPAPVIHFSKINLSETSILERSNLGQQFINYWKIMNKRTKLRQMEINDLQDVSYDANKMFNKITNYKLSTELNTELNMESNSELNKNKKDKDLLKYSKYLNHIIPQTKTVFELIKPTIVGKFTFKSIVDCLEPFMIYPEDIVYRQYKEINKYINSYGTGKIQTYVVSTSERETEFKKINVFRTKPVQIKQKNKPRLMNDLLDLLTSDSASDDINEYFQNVNKEKLTNSEILKEMIQQDFAKIFKVQLSLSMIDSVTTPDKVIVDMIVSDKNNDLLRPGENPCKNYIISKKYSSNEELESDNGKEIFFDKLYDDINYNILIEVEETFNKKNEVPYEVNSPEFQGFLRDAVKNKYKYNDEDLDYVIESLMNKSKRVLPGQYAIVVNENREVTYYIRTTESIWVIDPDVPPDLMDSSALCNNQPSCVYTKQKINSTCESMENIYKKTEKELLQQMENQYTEYNESIVQTRSELEDMVQSFVLELIKKQIFTVNDNKKIAIGNSVTDTADVIISPYSKLLDIVLSIDDFKKKQEFILKFTRNITRLANSENIDIITGKPEDENWLYCKETNTKLVPRFLYRLAFAYSYDRYNSELIRVIKECGVLSDDGDKIIDKYSGKIIKPIDFVVGEEFTEDGFKIISSDVLDEDAEIKSSAKNILVQDVNKYITDESKVINNIIIALSEQMRINIRNHHDFIISKVSSVYNATIFSEKIYNKKMDEKNKGKNPDKIDKTPYEDYINKQLLYLTLGCFLIIVQTNIPSLKINYTFPSCRRSFGGYPIDETDDTNGGLTYISCVALKLKSKIYPWKVLPSGKDKIKLLNTLVTDIKKYCGAYLMNDEDIIFKLQSKQRYLEQNVEEEQENNGDHEMDLWTTFLPPIKPFKIQNLVNVSDDFEERSLIHLKNGDPQQMDDMFVLKSKIILFSFAIQQLIHDVVSNEPLLMTDSLLENSCCNNSLENNTLQFFIVRKPDIELHNTNIYKFSALLNDSRVLTVASIFSSAIITKIQTFVLPYAFNEQTIFLAFIKYCNFKNTIPISEEISTICDAKPDYINLSDTSSEIIMKLKTHNKSYTEEQMKRLVQIVNRSNIIPNTKNVSLVDTLETETNTTESILTDILEKNDFEDDTLNQFIPVLQEYLMTNDFENLDRFLVIRTDAIQSEIIEFLKKYGKNKEIQESIDFLTEMIEEGTSKINNINNLNYIKSCIKMIGKILPGMIKNTVVYDVKVHPHLNIIASHKEDILNLSIKEYISIKKYYEDPTLNSEFLTNIQRIFSEIILLSDKIIINNSNFTHQVSLKLIKYFFIIGLYNYIINSKDLTEEEGSVVVELNARENLQNTKVASLLIDFIKVLRNHQAKINISYEDVMNKMFKSKEFEKNKLRKSRSALSPEALKIDNEFKGLKIGRWGEGQNVTGYDGERYEIEKQMMQQERMEAEAFLQFDNNPDIDEGDQDFDNEEDGDYMNDNADNENDE
jgi:hypothetical protein